MKKVGLMKICVKSLLILIMEEKAGSKKIVSFSESYFAVDLLDDVTNEKYSTSMTSKEIEEVSSDPEKYERKLKELRGAKKQTASTSATGTETDEASSTSNSFKWTTNNIKLMLQERLDMEPEFVNPKCKKVKLWGKIANKMREAGYHRIGGHDCNAKYRNLLQTYKQNKEKKSKTGESKITWEYFEMFDNVLGTKLSIIPDKNLLSTSIESEISDQSDHETELEADRKKEKLPKAMKKRKLCNELPVPQYLYLKEKRLVEDREFAVKKWDETKQLKKEEISAINNLALAIMEATKSRTTE